MHPTIFTAEGSHDVGPLHIDLGILYQHFQTIPDARHARGRRYPLAVLLTVAVLAKLAGYSAPQAIADWARLRAAELADLFDLARPMMPHAATWTRVLGHALTVTTLEQVVATLSLPAPSPELPARGSSVICLDGKTLRGTIACGQTQGVHLLSAYHAGYGVVLGQMAVDTKTNEIRVAPALLAQLNLAGTVVTGDALLTQRSLSAQIVEAGGDYFWWVKDNQPSLHTDITMLFTPEYVAPGWASLPTDFTYARSVDKGHSRIDVRQVTASSLLTDYSDWPYVAQVVRVERTRLLSHKTEQHVVYGITSLPHTVADATRLLAIGRTHWSIENGLHYRRDVTLHEDSSQVRRGQAPQVLAALNNLVCSLCGRAGITNLAALQRTVTYQLDQWLTWRRHVVLDPLGS